MYVVLTCILYIVFLLKNHTCNYSTLVTKMVSTVVFEKGHQAYIITNGHRLHAQLECSSKNWARLEHNYHSCAEELQVYTESNCYEI